MVKAVLIFGPTASGKSALAMEFARKLDGAIINADSQQVFQEWRVLTARPDAEDEATLPHYLYGNQPIASAYSVGQWLRDIKPILDKCREDGQIPIITGGTGLYFKALTEGIAPIPSTPPEIRARGEDELKRSGLAAFAEALAKRDPQTAATIDLKNPMRVLRAWESLETTGIGLAEWRARNAPPLLPLDVCDACVVNLDRETLYARCNARFDVMLRSGALEEVRQVRELGLPPNAPGMKVLGASELMQHLEGTLTLDEAAELAKTATRQYAKRQMTWARSGMSTWRSVTQTTAPIV